MDSASADKEWKIRDLFADHDGVKDKKTPSPDQLVPLIKRPATNHWKFVDFHEWFGEKADIRVQHYWNTRPKALQRIYQKSCDVAPPKKPDEDGVITKIIKTLTQKPEPSPEFQIMWNKLQAEKKAKLEAREAKRLAKAKLADEKEAAGLEKVMAGANAGQETP